MRPYSFKSYRSFFRSWLHSRPGQGRGELQKIAKRLKVHASTLSQILSGARDFSPDHITLIGVHMGLSHREIRFTLLLAQREKTKLPLLRSLLDQQINNAVVGSETLAQTLPSQITLPEETKTKFYSSWFYSAARILNSIPELQTIEPLSQRLRMPAPVVREIVDFLVRSGLCSEKNGKIQPGPSYTHLEATSPNLPRHHFNWRLKAIERHPFLPKEELCYTAPMSISVSDAAQVRKLAMAFIESVQKLRDPSPSEAAYCLNLDWFSF